MKKLLYCAAALATLLFAASCQQEKLEPVGGPVTFTVTTPGGLDTRAIADGENVNEVHYAVYKTASGVANALDAAEDSPLAKGVVKMANKKATLELDLLQDQDYTILFWAQVSGKGYYDTSDLRQVKSVATTVAGNDEDRAAFFQRHDFNTSTKQNYDVTLYRPFAQLNLGTTLASLKPVQDGQTQGYEIAVLQSEVVVSGLSSTFDLTTGKALAGNETFTHQSADTPANTTGEYLVVNGINYHYVAMNYLFVPEEDKLVSVSYKITTDKGVVENSINNVPVKENYRTNIVGNLLTSKTEFEIIVDERFNQPDKEADYVWGGEVQAVTPVNDVYSISTAAELAWVAQQVNSGENTFAGKTVQLVADIDLNNQPWTPIGLNADDAKKFKGTFEGVALTKADTYPVIRNLYVETSPGYTAAGFFGALNGTVKNFGIENATIKHISTGNANGQTDNGIAVVAGSIYINGNIEGVTVKNAIVEGNRYVGGIAGYTYGNVKNCSVENLTLKAIPNQLADGSYDNGDKVGGIVGAFWWESTYNVSGNTAKNVSIYAYRDAGIIAGFATGAGVKNNTVEGKNNITIDQETYFYADKPANAGEIVGNLSGALADGNAVTGDVSYSTLINVDEPESFASVVAAAKDGDIITVADGEFDLPSSVGATGEGTITFVGNGMESTQLNGSTNPSGNADSPGNYAHGKHLVFKDMTFKTVNVGYQGGFGHAASVTFINCKIIGQFYCHSEAPHYFYDCTIDPLTGYLYTYASDCVFEGCTFEASEGKALQVYGEADVECDVTIKDCTFKAAKQATTWDGKPVTGIDINSANGYRVNVTIENCKTTGFPTGDNSGSDLYNIKNGGIGKVNLVIDGKYIVRRGYTAVAGYPNLYVDTVTSEYHVFDLDGLKDLHDFFYANKIANSTWGKTYNISADIDADGYTWEGIWMNTGSSTSNGLILNGNNHTIENLTIKEYMFASTPTGTVEASTPGEVKNITMKNVTVNGSSHDATVFWGSCYGNVNFTNVTVDGAKISGGSNVGALMSRTTIEGSNSIVVNFTNCKVINSTLKADNPNADPTGASGFIGRAYGATKLNFSGCSVENNTIINENGLVGGKVYGYTTWYGDGFKGTGFSNDFNAWDGISFVAVTDEASLETVLKGAGAAGAGNTTIIIESDLDLTGKTWAPIKVDGYHGADMVVIDGNGKTITGLKAPLFAGGFAGNSGIVIMNLTIADSQIVSTNSNGSGAFIESVDSMDEIILRNCHVKNSTITGSRTGGLIGWTSGYNNINDGAVKTYVTIDQCSVVECTINGTSVGGINGHAGANAWTYTTIKDCVVRDCNLNSTDDGDWRVGVVVGTANVGEVTISNITESGNTLTQTGKTAPTGEKRNYYGRFVPGTTGKLTIDGVAVTE